MFIKLEKIKNKLNHNGFTLVEIMVAVSIFAIVATIATGALVTASDINRKAQAIKVVMDNVNFALNKMAFEIRLGGIYTCQTSYDPNSPSLLPITSSGVTCSIDTSPGFGQAIALITRRPDCANFSSCDSSTNMIKVGYRYVKIGTNPGKIEYSTNPTVLDSFSSITSPEVDITKLIFNVGGYGGSGSDQAPRVLIRVSGTVFPGSKYETNFDLQTTAASYGN